MEDPLFSSLHRIDFAIEGEQGQIAVQTDHRDAAEIGASYDLSVVFAAARALNPIRTNTTSGVRFTLMNEPPPEFVALLRAAGAEVEVMDREILPPAPDDALLDRLAGESLSGLGRRVLAAHGAEATAEGLAKIQQAIRAEAPSSPEDDEIAYWTAIVELGAVTGEILRQRFGGRWIRDPGFYSMIPFMFEQNGAMTNVFGKVERFFEHGDSEAPTHLLAAAEDARMEGGTVMFNLRPHDWVHREAALWRPLLQGFDKLESDALPLVSLVRDFPNTVRTLDGETPPEEVEALEAEARANLKQIEVQTTEIETDLAKILVVHGSYYASEKLLDTSFMKQLHERLGAELLLAAVPAKGQLHVTSALTDPQTVLAFGAIAAGYHGEAAPRDRLSTELLLVSGGAVVGVARSGSPPES